MSYNNLFKVNLYRTVMPTTMETFFGTLDRIESATILAFTALVGMLVISIVLIVYGYIDMLPQVLAVWSSVVLAIIALLKTQNQEEQR
jgi:hypothetical protein